MSFWSVEVFTVSSATPGLGLGVLGAAGHVGHVPIISDGHWVVVGCDLVDRGGIPGVGARPPMVQDASSPGSLAQAFSRKAASLLAILVSVAAAAAAIETFLLSRI